MSAVKMSEIMEICIIKKTPNDTQQKLSTALELSILHGLALRERELSLIHISEPRDRGISRMPSSA